jgi:hypothetical protein
MCPTNGTSVAVWKSLPSPSTSANKVAQNIESEVSRPGLVVVSFGLIMSREIPATDDTSLCSAGGDPRLIRGRWILTQAQVVLSLNVRVEGMSVPLSLL